LVFHGGIRFAFLFSFSFSNIIWSAFWGFLVLSDHDLCVGELRIFPRKWRSSAILLPSCSSYPFRPFLPRPELFCLHVSFWFSIITLWVWFWRAGYVLVCLNMPFVFLFLFIFPVFAISFWKSGCLINSVRLPQISDKLIFVPVSSFLI
jgi:hypothetical protein